VRYGIPGGVEHHHAHAGDRELGDRLIFTKRTRPLALATVRIDRAGSASKPTTNGALPSREGTSRETPPGRHSA
jgi:hypothetical protein